LDLDRLYRAARYDRGEADYLNAALDAEGYGRFVDALLEAEKAAVHDFDRAFLFEGCQPIEEIAASGPKSLAFGPLRPVGLADPRTGRRPHAVVQLRQENAEGTLYGLVGFQTRLKYPEQKRVFGLIPGLENAEFVRYGQLHRNFYLDTPRCCARDFSLADRPDVHVAGQISGVEGYVESITSGLVTAWYVAAGLQGAELPPLPPETMVGALLHGFLFDTTGSRFSPMNANYGLLPDLAERVRGKRDRKLAKSARATAALQDWLDVSRVRGLLAAS
jgi:methylenetetrahydrofolate--tRNA-(uracil-5-)-methyltransferase